MRELTLDQHMLEFLKAYRVFAAGTTATGGSMGEHNPFHFVAKYGLCNALDQYVFHSRKQFTQPYLDVLDELVRRLNVRFRFDASTSIFSGSAFPFGHEEYSVRKATNTQHECPERLAFVDRYIGHLEALL